MTLVKSSKRRIEEFQQMIKKIKNKQNLQLKYAIAK